MSTNHPYDPNHNDLPHGRGADARETDADALDALLNEIAQETRHTTARHGEGHHQPKGRSQTRDAQADDLPAFARAFHQRVERSDAADPSGAALDPTLWEQIMARTSPAQPAAAITPQHLGPLNTSGPGGNRTANHPRFRPPPLRGEMLANATLALLLILTAFSAWTVYDRVLAPPPVTPESTVPGVAMQPDSTPETVIVPTTDPTEDAPSTSEISPVPTMEVHEPSASEVIEQAFACDFTRDIPILLEVNTSPLDATVVLLTSTGDVVLSCPEEPNPIVLATNMGQAAPTSWPGVVSTMELNYEIGESPLTYINLFTGELVEIVPTFNQRAVSASISGQSPWVVQETGVDTAGDVSLIDLRTFDVTLLSSFFSPGMYPSDLAPMSSSSENGVLVVGLGTIQPETDTRVLHHEDTWPGAVMIVNGNLGDSHWIDLPEDLEDIREMILSPNGEFLALRSTQLDGEGDAPRTIYSVIRTSTGEEVGRSEVNSLFTPEMLWAADGDSLVFLDDIGLSFVSTVHGDIGRLVETTDYLYGLRPTYDPQTVLVTSVQTDEPGRESPTSTRSQTLSLNLQTGESIVMDGFDISQPETAMHMDPHAGWPTRVLLLAHERPVGSGPHSFQIVDPVTGQTLGEILDVEFASVAPDETALLGTGDSTKTASGAVQALSFSSQHLVVLQQQDDGLEVVYLPPLDADYISGVALTVSPDGQWLSATPKGQQEDQLRYLIDLNGAETNWQAITDDVPETLPRSIFFVPGTGAQG